MKLIVGLGNPEEKYYQNRHNVGFLFVDYLVQKYYSTTSQNGAIAEKFEQNNKFNSEILEKNTAEGKVIFAKPRTFMNRSGEAVQKIKNFYKISPESIIIAHDELDIPFGKSKIQHGVGPKVHNGLSSIETSLGTADFWRIRIGVDNRQPDRKISGESYVLQDFTEDEKNALPEIFDKIYMNGKAVKLF